MPTKPAKKIQQYLLASVVNFIRKRLRQIQGLVVHSYQLLLVHRLSL